MDGKTFVKISAKGGSRGGSSWDDGPQGTPRQIFISHGDSINSIQIAYYSNGKITLSDKHGGDSGDNFNAVDLGGNSLSWIRGYYGHHKNNSWEPLVVRSLRFGTDGGEDYGPFGTERGQRFSIVLDGARCAGFHGRSVEHDNNYFIQAIGIYVETIATAYGDGAQMLALTN